MKVYLSGPMTGHDKEEVRQKFAENEAELRRYGYKVVNPCRVWSYRYRWLYRLVGYRLTLLYDLWLLSRCDAIYQMPGGYFSSGCNIEWEWEQQFNMKIL